MVHPPNSTVAKVRLLDANVVVGEEWVIQSHEFGSGQQVQVLHGAEKPRIVRGSECVRAVDRKRLLRGADRG